MSSVEFLRLGEFERASNSREFDAVSHERFLWRGILRCQEWEPGQFRVYVFPDRFDNTPDYYAVQPGEVEEVEDRRSASAIIKKAITSTFEHRLSTVEVLSDGKGGWIRLETDT